MKDWLALPTVMYVTGPLTMAPRTYYRARLSPAYQLMVFLLGSADDISQ